MRLLVSWLRDFVDVQASAEEIGAGLGLRGFELAGIEPFGGSMAVLLGRPHAPANETVNDADLLVSNFWRATKYDPRGVAEFADWPNNESDVRARRAEQLAIGLGRPEITRPVRDPSPRGRGGDARRQVLLLTGTRVGIGRHERIGGHDLYDSLAAPSLAPLRPHGRRLVALHHRGASQPRFSHTKRRPGDQARGGVRGGRGGGRTGWSRAGPATTPR